MITFQAIHQFGTPIEQTPNYTYYHLQQVLDRYDSNFLALHQMPSINELKQHIEYVKNKAIYYDQNHAKLVFPANEQLPEEVRDYLLAQQYELSFLELYAINPQQFARKTPPEHVDICFLTERYNEEFLQFLYNDLSHWGKRYAASMLHLYATLIEQGEIQIVIALLEDEIVGATTVFTSEHFVEIDNFFVYEPYQKRGIGRAIQQFVMDYAKEKTVILVAEGEDTPKEMYRRQGYQYYGFQYAALNNTLWNKERLQVEIRQVQMNDLDRLVVIENQGFTPEEAASKEAFIRRISKIADTFLVATIDEEVVGFVNGPVVDALYITDDLFADIKPNAATGGVQSILGIAVEESYRNRGIAKKLLKAIEDIATAQQRTAISLTCKAHLIGFYESCGYENHGESDSQHGGVHWYNLIKKL